MYPFTSQVERVYLCDSPSVTVTAGDLFVPSIPVPVLIFEADLCNKYIVRFARVNYTLRKIHANNIL